MQSYCKDKIKLYGAVLWKQEVLPCSVTVEACKPQGRAREGPRWCVCPAPPVAGGAHTGAASRKGGCCDDVASGRLIRCGTHVGAEKPLDVQAVPGPIILFSGAAWPSVRGLLHAAPLSLSELQLHAPLPADRPASSARSVCCL